MTREEAIEQLKKHQQNADLETAHVEADDIICGLLKSLGYDDVVAEYAKIEKWYT